MFNCVACRQPIGPNQKPVRIVTGTRHVDYHNEYYVEDEWGNREKREVDSFGTEITGESLVCAPCAKQYFDVEVPVAGNTTIRIGRAYEEKLAPPLRVKMIANIVHTALDRVKQTSKRAAADSMIAVPLVKNFTDLNKGFVF